MSEAPVTARVGPVLVLLCRPGFEPECAAELPAGFQAVPESGSGLLAAEGKAGLSPMECLSRCPFDRLVFARDRFAGWPFALGETRDRIAPLLALARRVGPVGSLWLQHADTGEGRALSRLCTQLQARFEGRLREAGLLMPGNPRRLHVLFRDGANGFLGFSEATDGACWSMGIPRLRLPGAPSRSAAKLEEALLALTGDPLDTVLRSGMSAVDLGAAPGGWSWVLARRGLRVLAIDHGRLSDAALSAGAVRHLAADAFTWRPSRPVDWMVCDVVDKPARVMDLVQRWFSKGWCRWSVFNLKLPMKRRHAEVERLLARLETTEAPDGPLRFAARQLYHDREEITVFVAPI